jgi:hypothetical protein
LRTAANRLAARLPAGSDWVWPGDRVTYDSGRLPLALLLAAEALDDPSLSLAQVKVMGTAWLLVFVAGMFAATRLFSTLCPTVFPSQVRPLQ